MYEKETQVLFSNKLRIKFLKKILLLIFFNVNILTGVRKERLLLNLDRDLRKANVCLNLGLKTFEKPINQNFILGVNIATLK